MTAAPTPPSGDTDRDALEPWCGCGADIERDAARAERDALRERIAQLIESKGSGFPYVAVTDLYAALRDEP